MCPSPFLSELHVWFWEKTINIEILSFGVRRAVSAVRTSEFDREHLLRLILPHPPSVHAMLRISAHVGEWDEVGGEMGNER
jgi:hypothetical protein